MGGVEVRPLCDWNMDCLDHVILRERRATEESVSNVLRFFAVALREPQDRLRMTIFSSFGVQRQAPMRDCPEIIFQRIPPPSMSLNIAQKNMKTPTINPMKAMLRC